MIEVSMAEMLEAGVHFGHQTRYRNPKMEPYIYGARNKINIINLDITQEYFKKALTFIYNVAVRKGKILFVGTKRAAREIIQEEAGRCGMPYVDQRWLGGTLTNYKTVRQSIRRLKDLESRYNAGDFDKLTKKEALGLTRQLKKLQASLGGIKDMGGLPDVLFVIDVGVEHNAIAEANRLHIPVVGIVDTNNKYEGVDYMIPGNDDARRAIRLYAEAVANTILEAKQKAAPTVKEEEFVEVEVETEEDDSVKRVSAGSSILLDDE
ncbi:MAG: 30S ribosomal protein S2 [Gammaproteobacteria bacterium]